MAIKNIIFDFDGTLMDTAPVILATMRATISELGLPERSEAEMIYGEGRKYRSDI